MHVAHDLGLPTETAKACRRAEVDARKREGMSTQEREEIRKPRRENFELRRANRS